MAVFVVGWLGGEGQISMWLLSLRQRATFELRV
jgi:hypothetical protein